MTSINKLKIRFHEIRTEILEFNVLWTVHRDISVQQEPTGYTIYFQFISIINFYLFRAVSLLETCRG